MSDQDTEIRRAVNELVDAAPPAPPFPRVETVVRTPRRRPVGLVVAAVAIALVVAVIGGALVIDRTADEDAPVATTAPLPRGACPHLRDGERLLVRMLSTTGCSPVLGRVGLPTGRPLQLGIGNGTAVWPRYARGPDGAARKPFELIVPEAGGTGSDSAGVRRR